MTEDEAKLNELNASSDQWHPNKKRCSKNPSAGELETAAGATTTNKGRRAPEAKKCAIANQSPTSKYDRKKNQTVETSSISRYNCREISQKETYRRQSKDHPIRTHSMAVAPSSSARQPRARLMTRSPVNPGKWTENPACLQFSLPCTLCTPRIQFRLRTLVIGMSIVAAALASSSPQNRPLPKSSRLTWILSATKANYSSTTNSSKRASSFANSKAAAQLASPHSRRPCVRERDRSQHGQSPDFALKSSEKSPKRARSSYTSRCAPPKPTEPHFINSKVASRSNTSTSVTTPSPMPRSISLAN